MAMAFETDSSEYLTAKSDFSDSSFPEHQKDKFNLLCKRCQNGKTYEVTGLISDIMGQDDVKATSKCLHIVFTMNSIINEQQFSSRINGIPNLNGKIAMISSKKHPNQGALEYKKNLDDLKKYVGAKMFDPDYDITDAASVVLLCTNHKTVHELEAFIKCVDKFKKDNPGKFVYDRVNIYFDEIHKNIDSFGGLNKLTTRQVLENVCELDVVHSIYGMTATPYKLFNKWNVIETVLPSAGDINSDEYVSLDELESIEIDDFKAKKAKDGNNGGKEATQFGKHVLKKYPEICENGTRVFFPGDVTTEGHRQIKEDVVWTMNKLAVVVVLNGLGKKMYFNESEVSGRETYIDLNAMQKNVGGCEEISNTIVRAMKNNNLMGRTLVYTGNLSIGMGTTLTHREIGPFTHAVIYTKKNATGDDAYQLAGRAAGRMRNWETFDPDAKTKVYWMERTKTLAIGAEMNAQNVEQNLVNQAITETEFTQPSKDYEKRMGEEKVQRKAAVKAEEKARKIAQREAEKAEKRRVATDKDGEILDGVLTVKERDRLIGKGNRKGMFAKWAKEDNNNLIAKFMSSIDPDEIYTENEFNKLLKDMKIKTKTHLLHDKVYGTNGFGAIFKQENNTYKMYGQLNEAWKLNFRK